MHALGKKLGRIIPVLFPHLTGRRAGTRINDFRKGVGDGRARRDEGDGPPDAGGVDRYHIVSPADLQDVARRLAGTFQGTSGVAEVDRSALTSENHSARL